MAEEIDDAFYSRQRYVYGDAAMRTLSAGRVLLLGCNPLGLETAKNLILTGPQSVLLVDEECVTEDDVSSLFCVRAEHLGQSRSAVLAAFVRELNGHVLVEHSEALPDSMELFDCVLVCQLLPWPRLLALSEECRRSGAKLIVCGVWGLMAWMFADFGSRFTVSDATGEATRHAFVGHITQAANGVVSTLDEQPHGLSDGDCVVFSQVQGMTGLNGQTRAVIVMSVTTFGIGDTREMGGAYAGGGVVQQVKQPVDVQHRPIDEFDQFDPAKTLTVDFEHENRESDLFACVRAVLRNGAMTSDEAKAAGVELADPTLYDCCFTGHHASHHHAFAPLCSVLGGLAAQECVKALTGKFTPLTQWLLLDVFDLRVDASTRVGGVDLEIDLDRRYDSLVGLLGRQLVRKLLHTRVFMVGCGAIGCELLKLCALLGLGTGGLTVTDNDLIETSNLNRQFLFRRRHVQQSKSVVAAQVVGEMNGDLLIRALQQKVCAETEQATFNDAFYENVDVVLNALDNVQARLYMDNRCVQCSKPLIESGTLATKAHVQVIVPHMTETYASQRDPPEHEAPMCTVKSFPSQPEHAVQWARNKFESLFTSSAREHNRFWAQHAHSLAKVRSDYVGEDDGGQQAVERDVYRAVKLVQNRPRSAADCIVAGRNRLLKYFSHAALQLLVAFPVDSATPDGQPFWSLPKRPPQPIRVELDDPVLVDAYNI